MTTSGHGAGIPAAPSQPSRNHPKEWDAQAYHRLGSPMLRWGIRVIDRLRLQGHETVIDAGCGSGRVTAQILDRLPQGRVIAVDLSTNMLAQAREFLEPRYPGRVEFHNIDLLQLPAFGADALFSTATFHWVPDHVRLFQRLFAALKPGGRLAAQFGAAGNLFGIYSRATQLVGDDPGLAGFFSGWSEPVQFPTPTETVERAQAAGFTAVNAWTQPEPTTFANQSEYEDYIMAIILRAHLAHLPPDKAQSLVARLGTMAAQDNPSFTLDYVRLNLDATRPPS